jgi:predicted metal-binding protein
MRTLFVCITCKGHSESPTPEQPRPGLRPFAALRANAVTSGGGIVVVAVACLANCARACTVAVSGSGKWSYVVGALDPDRDAADVIAFARRQDADAAGVPPWRHRLAHVRKNTVARVPPPSRLPQPETAAR